MDKKTIIFNNLIKAFINSKQYSEYLGSYNSNKRSITLYDVSNTTISHSNMKTFINNVTKKYKYVILDKDAKYTNVNILDIEL